MKTTLLLILISILHWSCSSRDNQQGHPSGLVVVELSPSKWTSITKQNLLHLTQIYDLSPFLFTKVVHIDSKALPSFHPVLTLNTGHAESPKKILAEFLHGEAHWWMSMNQKSAEAAARELKKVFPKAQAEVPEGGHVSPQLHLLICHIELRALEFYLGKKEAREIISGQMKQDKRNVWVYSQVLQKDAVIRKTILRHKLLPPPLS